MGLQLHTKEHFRVAQFN